MSMVCGLDLHRGQITFDTLEVETGDVWRGRIWQPDRERFRREWSGDNGITLRSREAGAPAEGVRWEPLLRSLRT